MTNQAKHESSAQANALHVCPDENCNFRTGCVELWPACPTHGARLVPITDVTRDGSSGRLLGRKLGGGYVSLFSPGSKE